MPKSKTTQAAIFLSPTQKVGTCVLLLKATSPDKDTIINESLKALGKK